MHTCHVIAFVLLAGAAVIAAAQRGWALALTAGGLAVYVLPIAFELQP